MSRRRARAAKAFTVAAYAVAISALTVAAIGSVRGTDPVVERTSRQQPSHLGCATSFGVGYEPGPLCEPGKRWVNASSRSDTPPM